MKRLVEELEPGFETSLLAASAQARPSAEARERALLASTAALATAAGMAGVAGMAAPTTAASTGLVGSGTGAAGKLAALVAWKSIAIGAILGGVVVGVGVESAHSFDHASILVGSANPIPRGAPSAQARPFPVAPSSPLREVAPPPAVTEPAVPPPPPATPLLESAAPARAASAAPAPRPGPTTAPDPPPPPAVVPETTTARPGASVGSSRVDLQACKLEYSIVSPK